MEKLGLFFPRFEIGKLLGLMPQSVFVDGYFLVDFPYVMTFTLRKFYKGADASARAVVVK